jgi:hypothetical protein
MNNPAAHKPLRYMLRNNSVVNFYSWPFPKFNEESPEVDFFEYHGYLALLSFTPDDLERLLDGGAETAGDGVY